MNTSFEKLIENLLHRYECVILPEFGGFIVRESPCNFSASGDKLKPYSKHIFFNPHLTLNDGLVYNEIQTLKGCTYNEAIQWYGSTLESYKKTIEEAGSLKFGDLGTFFQGKENSYWFSPNSDLNLARSTYGLYPIEVRKVAKEIKEPLEPVKAMELASQTSADRKPIESLEPVKMNYKAWIAAATIAFLVHFVYLKVEKTDVTTNEASVLPTFPSKKKQVTESLPMDTLETLAIDTTAEIVVEGSAPKESSPESEQIVATPSVESSHAEVQIEVPTEHIPEQGVTAPVEEEVESTFNYVQVAKYRLENNALFHKKDLEKKGKNVRIELVNGLYEVQVEQ